MSSRESLELVYYVRPMTSAATQTTHQAQVQMPLAVGQPRPYPRPFHRGHLGEMMYSPASLRLTTLNLADVLSQLEQRSNMSRIVTSLNEFDGRLVDVFVGYDLADKQPTVNAKLATQTGTVSLPLNVLGDGTRRLTDLLVLLPLARNGVGLIDEVESGIYHENLSKLWAVVDLLSREHEVQVFATTHSWECVGAAVRVFRDSPGDFRIHRLERHGDEVRVVTYDQELAEAAVTGYVEVR